MKTFPYLHRVTVGRSREVRGPDALELGAVAACVLAVIVVALSYGLRQIHMAEVTEAIALVSGPSEYNLIEYRALYGGWPPYADGDIVGGNRQGAYVKNIALGRDGVLTAELALRQNDFHPGFIVYAPEKRKTSGDLSFRPVLMGASGYETMMLLCGNAVPPVGVSEPHALNHTTIPEGDLPLACRGGRR